MGSSSDLSIRVCMQLIRVVNLWKAYDRRGQTVDGQDLTAGEIQTIKAVTDLPERNTTELAHELGVTKGAISQAVTKLVARGCLERYRAPGNERETYTRSTEQGARIYQGHNKKFQSDMQAFDDQLDEASEDQIEFMMNFLARRGERGPRRRAPHLVRCRRPSASRCDEHVGPGRTARARPATVPVGAAVRHRCRFVGDDGRRGHGTHYGVRRGPSHRRDPGGGDGAPRRLPTLGVARCSWPNSRSTTPDPRSRRDGSRSAT